MTFMQAWGQLVWMTIANSILGIIIWYNIEPLSAVLIAVTLVCLELAMFLWKAFEPENHHPLAEWHSQIGWGYAAFMTFMLLSLVTCTVFFTIAITNGTWHQALGIMMLVIGQACLSESIHRVAHKDTLFHHRHLTTWLEPVLYAGAIIGVVGGVWFICQ